MNLAIDRNRSAAKYSSREQILRVAWAVGRLIFRSSPRPCFGFRSWLLRLFGARIGNEVHVYPSARVYFPWNLTVGDWSALGEEAVVYNLGKAVIGARVTISQRAHLCGGTHDYTQPDMPLIKSPIVIADQAWICADAFVGPGVSVGEGAVVGARAVVIHDVAPWTVVAGNPARFVKTRTLQSSTGSCGLE